MTNALLQPGAVPAFDTITEEDFLPALDEAFAEAQKAFEAVRDNMDEPGFENTVVPFDKMFSDVTSLFNVLYIYFSCAKTDGIPAILEEAQNRDDEFFKAIYQDRKMGARFKAVYDLRDELALDDQDIWFLENLYRSFENNGAFLDAAGQSRLKEIDAALIAESMRFNENVDNARKQQAFLITDPAQLKGVPDDKIAAFAENARNNAQVGWRFVPERLLVDELLECAENRDFRRRMHEAMDAVGTVSPYDNRDIIQKMQALRHERAQLLGYDNYAESHLAGTMAGSVGRVDKLIDDTLASLIPSFEKDIAVLQAWVSDQGGPVMEPWDVAYYTTRYKNEVLKFDNEAYARCFTLDNVMAGWLKHAEKSMNMSFEKTGEYPVWDPSVTVYKTIDHDTGKEGVLYFDLFARDNKCGGAWMSEAQTASPEKGRLNAITFNMNLVKPDGGQTVYISPDQISTFYHEGGHALNGLKGTEAKYSSRAGTGNGSDYVEIHSMISENWPFHPDVLSTYASVPADLLKAKAQSDAFMAAAPMLRLVQNARRDLKFHSISPDAYGSDKAIEAAARSIQPIAIMCALIR